MISNKKLGSRNCLFLICPTDHIEGFLGQVYAKKAYFYTALGASFNWDIPTQNSLVTLIENHKIHSIVFITKYTNIFYKEALESSCESLFQVNDILLGINETLPNYLLKQSHPILRTMLLASRHLQRQKKHILQTSILGRILKQKNITIKSLVYHTDSEMFYTPEMIEKKVLLHSKIYLN